MVYFTFGAVEGLARVSKVSAKFFINFLNILSGKNSLQKMKDHKLNTKKFF